jgi:hypothetical protein
MPSYMNLVVLALAASGVIPALSAPIQYRYRNLLVELRGSAVLISGIPLGTHVVSNSLVQAVQVPALSTVAKPAISLPFLRGLSLLPLQVHWQAPLAMGTLSPTLLQVSLPSPLTPSSVRVALLKIPKTMPKDPPTSFSLRVALSVTHPPLRVTTPMIPSKHFPYPYYPHPHLSRIQPHLLPLLPNHWQATLSPTQTSLPPPTWITMFALSTRREHPPTRTSFSLT